MRNVIARSRKATWQSLAAFLLPLTLTLAACGDDDSSSASAGPNDDPGVESSSSEAITSSSSEEVSSIPSVQEPFNPGEYRTCDKKYEGKFLMYQYRETLDAWNGTYRINADFYKCENGKWSGPSATSPENLTEGDVIRAAPDDWEGDEFHVAPDDWECDAENEGQVQSWRFMVFSVPHSPMGYTPTYYARCEQGDWVLCEPESSSSSSMDNASSSSVKSSSSSSVILSASEESSSSLAESSSSVAESSSSVVTPQSSSSSTSVSSSSADVQSSSSETESSSSSSEDNVDCSALLEEEREKDRWNWDIPKECRFNPDIAYGIMTDSRDGQTYKTVKIGDQTWMAENLNFDPGQGGSDDAKYDWSWCNEEPKNCAVAGRLYTWAAAIDSVKLSTDADNPQDCGYGKTCTIPAKVQGVCPEGWHLPTSDEWAILFDAVGGQSNAGKVLKSQTGWYHNGNGTDGVGFSALPAGRVYEGNIGVAGISAFFWSSTEDDEDDAYNLFLDYDGGLAYLSFRSKVNAYSVRCLKD